MFCSNCGSKLLEGAKFCSVCGTKVVSAEPDEQEAKPVADKELTDIQKIAADEKPISKPKKNKISFDWSNVIDEPIKKEIPDVKSPWSETGSIDEKELYSEMTPYTDRSRTMSFIDMLKQEKETREGLSESLEETSEPTEAVELKGKDDRQPQKDNSKYSFYVPELYDETESVETPFDNIPVDKPVYESVDEPVYESVDEPVYEDYEIEDSKTEVVDTTQPAEAPDEFDFSILDDYQTESEEIIAPKPPEKARPQEQAISDLEEQLASILANGKGLVGKETERKEQKKVLDQEESIDENELFREIEIEAPKKTGMTIAAPADKESEIEALKRRLAELMDTSEEPEEIEKKDTLDVEDLFSDESIESITPVEKTAISDKAEDMTAPKEDVRLEEYLLQTVDYDKEPVLAAADTKDSHAEAEEEPESDALSIEELEKDIFGEESATEIESEATKKIDKFYTLYRKNEEFQKLLDEEYNKLNADDELVVSEEVKSTVNQDDISSVEKTVNQDDMSSVEKPVAAAFGVEPQTIPEEVKVGVPFAKVPEEVSAQPTVSTAIDSGMSFVSDVPVATSADANVAAAVLPGTVKIAEEAVQDEEDEEGGGALTIIAVILAAILIILLAVLLVLQLAPDSAAALKIDSIIENITSQFSAVDVIKNEFLL